MWVGAPRMTVISIALTPQLLIQSLLPELSREDIVVPIDGQMWMCIHLI